MVRKKTPPPVDVTGVYVVYLPRIDEVIVDVELDDLGQVPIEAEDRYNEWCHGKIREAVEAQVMAGYPPYVLTNYPFDTEESRDLVGVDESGAVVVLDPRGEPMKDPTPHPTSEVLGYQVEGAE